MFQMYQVSYIINFINIKKFYLKFDLSKFSETRKQKLLIQTPTDFPG